MEMKRVGPAMLALIFSFVSFSFASRPQLLGRLPLSFEANLGQLSREVQFLSRGPGYVMFLSENETQINLKNGEHRATVRMELLQSSRRPSISGLEMQPGRTNYIFPDDPARSITNIPNYAKVRYSAVYPGIDWLYYGDRQRLEYDFIVAPGADPKQIAVKFRDTRNTDID